MRVLLTGGNGQVGRELLAQTPTDITCVAPSSTELDITRMDQVRAWVKRVSPQLIINAAAYTAVDLAQSEPERAWAINHQGVVNLAAAAKEAGARFFQLSTDYVFDGNAKAAYVETAPCQPLNVYGASKLAGETALQTAMEHSLILRTSWVFSCHGNNFVKTMLRLGQQRSELGVVADQYGSPTSAADIATVLWQLASQPQAKGVFHYSGAPRCSWYQFATQIFSEAHTLGLLQRVPQLAPLTTAEYPTAASRPANSALDCSLLHQDFGITQPDWRHALRLVLAQLRTTPRQ